MLPIGQTLYRTALDRTWGQGQEPSGLLPGSAGGSSDGRSHVFASSSTGSCCLTSSLEGRKAERYPFEGTTWAWWLWRDYIDEVVFEGLHEKEAAAMPGGCTGKRFACKLQIGRSAKLNRREIALYRTGIANTLCQGPVAAEAQVAASCTLAGFRDASRSLPFLRVRMAVVQSGPVSGRRLRGPESGDTSGASVGLGQCNPVAGVGDDTVLRQIGRCNKMSSCDLLGADTVSGGRPFCPLQEVTGTD